MKTLLLQYARYHDWANRQLLAASEKLSPEQQRATVSSSFPSVWATILHMWDAEAIWWQRLRLQERIVAPSSHFEGTLPEMAAGWQQQTQVWLKWLEQAPEHALQHEFIYHNTKREQFKQPTFQVLLHLFNHGTYHRGQLVTLLRQAGQQKIPATDFIVWSRGK